MDQTLLRAYFGTIYELPSAEGTLRVSLDGQKPGPGDELPKLLTGKIAIITAYNPRSMLLPRKVNEQRHQVMRELLILGCYRVDTCVGFEDDPEGSWREPSWLVHGIDREEAIHFGRTFRQNSIVYSDGGRPELIVTDPTCDAIGTSFAGHFRVRQ